ncbi:MAG TPA: RIP metalloprotease RseP [Acidobacteriota bacterium]|nr:RIP metalloprotease RseP [Acidobacteriota bacterium]
MLLLTILSFVVVLGILITVHEFGHFAMAKLLKIRVLVFSIGFGPRLVGFTRGDTEYRVSPIPLGGYVKMAGEAFSDECKGDPGEFLSHPKWHRFLVAVSGPMMNILLAVAIFTVPYMQGVYVPRYPKEPAIVGPVSAGSIAAEAGIQPGDRIVSVNRSYVTTWEDMEITLGTAPRNALTVEILRDNQTMELRLDPPPGDEIISPISLGFRFPLSRTIVHSVDEKSPAYQAGLRAGDEILSVEKNGAVSSGYNRILTIISESKGIPLKFEVLRPDTAVDRNILWDTNVQQSGTIHHFDITPTEDAGRVIIGFVADFPSDKVKLGLIGAVGASIKRNSEMTIQIFTIIGRILTGSASVKNLAGPIEIARISGESARDAVDTGSARGFLLLLGLISLNLGIINLLPIPILDGGVIALLLVESVIGRDLSIRIKEKIVQAGFFFLILLMAFVIFNDLTRVFNFSRIFP